MFGYGMLMRDIHHNIAHSNVELKHSTNSLKCFDEAPLIYRHTFNCISLESSFIPKA